MNLQEFNKKLTDDENFRRDCENALLALGEQVMTEQIAEIQYKSSIHLNEKDKRNLYSEVLTLKKMLEILEEMLQNPKSSSGAFVEFDGKEYYLTKIDSWNRFDSDDDAFDWLTQQKEIAILLERY